MDLCNNSLDPSEAPAWIQNLKISSICIQPGRYHGLVPQKLFSLPMLQKVTTPNGTPDMGSNISNQLQIDLQELRGLPSSMALGRNGTEVERRNFRRFLCTIIRSLSFLATISHDCITEVSVMRG
ncbi:uncharacterized protein LOC110039479 [Phalaenopsis equestris]|uniref:uncharacterized protein LOC110039479 n=1 Tax=Phalaenopsis equestris TaxID=78828 RepID=UPI0009E624C0|nr:uncharacterized protein LOC110039479 [Phalaenopsis equestris]XP_020600216.1 uncharacterized protein LOC110039479 [Phalaenopsis equestris]XP_020600217.1 uncharacterized protein LOC110039479 [Phalaenopsis equestris]